MQNNWHLKLFSKSILKQNKLKAINAYLAVDPDGSYLDIGGDNGLISYFLRQRGGNWKSADLEEEAVAAIKYLVGESVYKLDGKSTPFPDDNFNGVVIIDFLEHIHTDREFIQELYRIIKDKGALIINVPYLKRFSLLYLFRKCVGMGPASHGHVRAGYTLRQLQSLLKGKFTIVQSKTYSRFFTESVDTIIGLFTKASGGKTSKKGLLVTQGDFRKKAKAFKLYSIIYPFVWLISRLDFLLFFTRGYSLIVQADKE